jgi:hypothetical protein
VAAPTVLRLVRPVTRDDLDRARAAHGWRLANVVPASAERPFQVVFLGPAGEDVVHFVDDARARVQYFLVSAPAREAEVRASFEVVAGERPAAAGARR